MRAWPASPGRAEQARDRGIDCDGETGPRCGGGQASRSMLSGTVRLLASRITAVGRAMPPAQQVAGDVRAGLAAA